MAEACGACGETEGAREHVSGRVGGGLHVTVRRRSDGRLRLELCKDCRLYHCPFCKPSVYKPKGDYASVWTHVEIHRMRALQHGEFNIHSCHLKCRGDRHFHCPYCAKTIINRKQFESHMDKCLDMQSPTKTAPGVQSAAPPPGAPAQSATTAGQCTILLLSLAPPVQKTITMGWSPALTELPAQPKSTVDQPAAPPDHSVKPNGTSGQRPASPNLHTEPTATPDPPVQLTSTLTVKQTGQRKIVQRKIKCPLCNLYLHKKNLRKHNFRKHLISGKDVTAKDHLRSQCIDSHNGVYAVAKSYKASAVPVHVIKKRSDSTHKLMCEEDRCEVILDFRRRSGMPDSQCPHLRSVDFCFSHAGTEDLRPDVLEELVANKWIGKDMGAKCLDHRDQASQSAAPLVTLVDLGGSHCLYLSVFEPRVSQYSKSGRLFVTYNVKGRLWHCDCSRGRASCLHKCIAKWFLLQTNKEFFPSDAKRDAPLSIADLMKVPPSETSTEKSAGAVCPLGEEGLKQTAMYIYDHKKLPSTFPENQPESETHVSKYLVPAETVCHECQAYLTEPVLITNNARVFTLTGALEDNSTFFKKCPACEMIYRYQEWTDGLHNYNNHTILSLQLCVLLQNSIKNHSADGGVVEVLERTIGVKSPCSVEVLQAYLHFEALTSHDCPSAVMMDLYQKGIFSMAGIEIKGLPESFTGDVNAEEVWESVCMEMITNSLLGRSSPSAATSDSNFREAAVSAVTSSFTLQERKRLSKQRTEECHSAVTRYLVKGLHPLSTVESPWFKEMTKTLNPKYHPPSREQLVNTLIPSWYSVEKKHVIKELLQVSKAAVTCDCWTSFTHEHYLTVTLHFVMKGQMKQKVLHTKPVFDTDAAVAEQVGGVLKEFGVRDKVVAVTAGNTFGTDTGIKKSQLWKLRCFANILSLAAQKVCTDNTVAVWAAKIRAAVVWIRRSSTAQTVLQKKQQLLNLPRHTLVLDVRARWSSLYLMMERFVEQHAAVQATITDPHIKPSAERKRLETLTDDDRQKAEEFIRIMKPLYTSVVCVSADKSPTCSQIFPILKKLEAHFEAQGEDTLFTATLKEKVWSELSTCYKDGDTWTFLQESSAMDPRFKNRVDSDEIWCRVKNAAVRLKTTPEVSSQDELEDSGADDVSVKNDKEHSDESPPPKKQRLSALEELFEEEDRALKSSAAAEDTPPIPERVQRELKLYRNLPAVPTSEDALTWWWDRRDTLPLLSELSSSYLCIQASSTPQERVFSTAGDTISQERSHVVDQVDMQIFLQKNC